MGLLDGAHIRAYGYLHHPVEAQQLHSGGEFFRGGMLAELTDEGGGHNGDDLVALEDGLNHLENLALVHDGAEGAADQALAAGNALVLVDHRPAVLIGADGIHAAGSLAGPLHVDDGVVGAGLGTFAALDALTLVNAALAVDEGDGPLGADLLAGGGQAVLAVFRHPVLVGGAGVAGVGDDVDERRLIVLLGDGRVIHALGHEAAGLDGPDAKAHGKPHPLTGDGPLQEDALPVQGLVAGDDLVGQVLGLGIISAGIGHAGHFGEHVLTDVRNQGRNSSHFSTLHLICFMHQ